MGQAVPHLWLENGKRITVKKAPTYFDPISYTIESRIDSGEVEVYLELSDRNPPAKLLVRIRHPEGKPAKEVIVNGTSRNNFNANKEWIEIINPHRGAYELLFKY